MLSKGQNEDPEALKKSLLVMRKVVRQNDNFGLTA